MPGTTRRLSPIPLPYKNNAIALLYAVLLGPIGLLYSSLRGGIIMLLLAFIVLSHPLPVPIALTWLGCCIWAVFATNRYNQKLLQIWIKHSS